MGKTGGGGAATTALRRKTSIARGGGNVTEEIHLDLEVHRVSKCLKKGFEARKEAPGFLDRVFPSRSSVIKDYSE